MRNLTPYEAVYRYVEFIAEFSPLRFRLRKYDRKALADVIRIAVEKVCNGGVPPFINPPDLWPVFQQPLKDARTVLLVHRALDLARKEYNEATGWTGGPAPWGTDPECEAVLSRYTAAGQAQRNEPTVALERGKAEATEERAPEVQARENEVFLREAEAENERYRRELDSYETWQPDERRRTAVQLLRRDLSYAEIAKLTCNAEGRRGISERILSPLRAALLAMSDRHMAALRQIAEQRLLTDDDGLPYTDDGSLRETPPPDPLQVAEETPEPDADAPSSDAEAEDRTIPLAEDAPVSSTRRGRRSGRRRYFSDEQLMTPPARLAGGSVYPRCEEPTACPAFQPPTEGISVGSAVHHAGLGVVGLVWEVREVAGTPQALVSFGGESRWVKSSELKALPENPTSRRIRQEETARIEAERKRRQRREEEAEAGFRRHTQSEGSLQEMKTALASAGLTLTDLLEGLP